MRAYDYQIHRLLGKVFAQAGRQRISGPIWIKGPAPYVFEVIGHEPNGQSLIEVAMKVETWLPGWTQGLINAR